MDLRHDRPRQTPDQIVLGELVHQEADRAAVHAVDRDAVAHEAMQRLQHQAVAAERDDGIGVLRLDVAVARNQPVARRAASGTSLATKAIRSNFLATSTIRFPSRRATLHDAALAAEWRGRTVEGSGRRKQAMEKDTPILVYATFPSRDEAERIGGRLVDDGLAACVNILPGMVSIYVWQGNASATANAP